MPASLQYTLGLYSSVEVAFKHAVYWWLLLMKMKDITIQQFQCSAVPHPVDDLVAMAVCFSVRWLHVSMCVQMAQWWASGTWRSPSTNTSQHCWPAALAPCRRRHWPGTETTTRYTLTSRSTSSQKVMTSRHGSGTCPCWMWPLWDLTSSACTRALHTTCWAAMSRDSTSLSEVSNYIAVCLCQEWCVCLCMCVYAGTLVA